MLGAFEGNGVGWPCKNVGVLVGAVLGTKIGDFVGALEGAHVGATDGCEATIITIHSNITIKNLSFITMLS